MNVDIVSIPEEDAEKMYQEYAEAVKVRKEKYLDDLKKVYHALKQGKRVIDIYEAFKKTGIGEDGNPKLAISLADKTEVQFEKEPGGAGWFSSDVRLHERGIDVRLPGNTFPDWPIQDNNGWRVIVKRQIQTTVPIVPAHLLPSGKLERYYLLWEVEEWNPIAAAKDPFLLRRINANTFIVLAEWDLTEVEQIVMRGR